MHADRIEYEKMNAALKIVAANDIAKCKTKRQRQRLLNIPKSPKTPIQGIQPKV
jgi:hypothetical protein